MKKTVVKAAGTGLLSVTLSAVWMTQPALAQDAGEAADRAVVQEGDNDFDWGWIGLFGLLGLGGLMRRDRHHVDRHETAATTTSPRT